MIRLAELRWQPQIRSNAGLVRFVRVECALVRRACDLTDEQEQKLKQIDSGWIAANQNAVGAAKRKQVGILGMIFGAPGRPVVQQPISVKRVHQSLAEFIDDLLNTEQQKAYELEKRKREEFRSGATADVLVEVLHQRLMFSEDQRHKIRQQLIPWVTGKDIYTQYYLMGNNQYPDIPTQLLRPILSDDQMKTYNALQRFTITVDNFNDGQPLVVIRQ